MLLKKYSLKELLVLLVGAVFNRILNKLNYYSKYLPLKREINYFVANGCDVFSYGRSLRIANFKRYPSLNFEIRKHTSDIFVFRQVIIKEEYSPIVELIKSKINKEDVKFIVDAGANVGFTSLYFSTLFNNSRIVAIEPDLSNYQQLTQNVILNGMREKILILNNALWINNTDKLSISSEFRDGENWAKSVKLSIDNDNVLPLTLSDVVNKQDFPNVIDILKIDIEGAEFELFNSVEFLNILSCNVRFLCIEIHEEFNSRQWYYGILNKLGFISFDKNETTFCFNKKFVDN